MGNDKKISQLNAVVSLIGTEYFPVVQSGETKKATINNILDLVPSIEWGAITGVITDQTDLIDLLEDNYYKQGGNSFTATAILGTNDLYDLLFETNGTSRGGVSSAGKWMFGLTTAIASTDVSIKGSGNTSATYALKVQDSSGGLISSLDNDGFFSAYGGLSTDGVKTINADTANNRYYFGQQAGLSNTGNSVFFAGYLAGWGNANNGSIGIGYNTLVNNTGENCTALGSQAGAYNTQPYVFFAGVSAGYQNTGSSVVGIGYESMYQNSGVGSFGIGNYSFKLNTGSDGFASGGRAGENNTGNYVSFFGTYSGEGNTAHHVKALGYQSARGNTIADLFTVSNISNIFWNNIGDEGYTTLQTVTMQAAMSADGTNTSAASSIFKIAPARGTGNAASGNVVIQRANVQASGTTRHTLSDGLIYEAQTGYITSSTSTSEDVLLIGAYQSKSGTYTALPTDHTIECTSGTFTVTLYTAVGYKGREIVIKKSSNAGTITVDGNGSETIDGNLTENIVGKGALKLMSNGTNWIILN